MTTIRTVIADITKLEHEAIVNSANPSLMYGSGISYAIHKAAGLELEKECLAILNSLGTEELPTGESILTSAHNLPSKYVIHVVGPVYGREGGKEAELLQSAYTSCLQLAEKHSIRSIVFPAISCGIYGFPKEEAAKIAIKTVTLHLSDNSEAFDEIVFVFTSDSHRDLFQRLLSDSSAFDKMDNTL